jgi:hypothetical protein
MSDLWQEHLERDVADMTGRRFGRLAAPPGPGGEVRCQCDRCGAHLLATTLGGGSYSGICPVCGGDAITPVG